MNLLSGGTATFGDGLTLGANGARGAALVSAASLTAGGTLRLGTTATGQAGAGALVIQDGSTVQDTAAVSLAVGASPGCTGDIAITGAGSRMVLSGLAVVGGDSTDAGIIAGGAGNIGVASGALLETGDLSIFAGSSVSVDAGSQEIVHGNLSNNGDLANSGRLTVTGAVLGGTLSLRGGLADVGQLRNAAINLGSSSTTLRTSGLEGANTVTGMQFGDVIDLAGITGATLSADGTVTANGTLTLGTAPGGYVYKLYGDAAGGTEVLLDPVSPPADAISTTNASTGVSSTDTGTEYSGPVDYLQREYVYSGADAVAIRANVPNVFLKGGPNGDALQAAGGNNVLDGGGGSNFLIGGAGTDAGRDTFFLDGRSGVNSWSTVVGFHAGDQATIFGFHSGLSTLAFTASEGAAGYTGFAMHSELGGAGTGVNASLTFAGIDPATVAAHVTFTGGTLLPGTPNALDYLLLQWDH